MLSLRDMSLSAKTSSSPIVLVRPTLQGNLSILTLLLPKAYMLDSLAAARTISPVFPFSPCLAFFF